MDKFFLLMLFIASAIFAPAQDLHITRTGKIVFHAGTSLEDIDAVNNEAASVINVKTGEIAFTVLIKSFHFKRALMEEHFNENYMESSKYPKSVFKGFITDIGNVNFSGDGSYKITAEGDLTIHNITKRVTVPAVITVTGGKIAATAGFKVKIADYNIKIPGVVADKISKEADIKIDCRYEPR
jgi:polyisoprenoid-binding protein YceI